MTDKIIGVEDAPNKDRSELNVGGRAKNNKMMIVVVFLVVALGVLATGVYLTISRISASKADADIPVDNNFIAGADTSIVEDSNNYFETIRKEKKRKEDLEAARAAKAEKEKKEMEEKIVKKENPPIVKKTTTRVEKQEPKPQPQPEKRSGSGSGQKTLTPEQRKMQGDVLVRIKGTGREDAGSPPQPFSKSFNAFAFENGQAGLREKGSLDFMLIHGTSLPCAIYTQIISDYEGYVTCRITQDVYSANGAALLVEKGSLVNGTQSVAMEQGKSRIFTTWSDVETPLGATIRIDSLGTGPLGASGIEAWVDNHFKERFGGAILLSFVDDALGALSKKLAGNTGANVDNSTENASDMASKALESSINIKPTGYAFIGQKINILVVRDIDMSSVYHFEDEEEIL